MGELSAAQQKRLEAGRETAKLSYTLATIDVNAPIDCHLNDCVLRMPFPYAVKQKFAELDFRSLTAPDYFETPQEGVGAETAATKPDEEKYTCRKITLGDVKEAADCFVKNAGKYVACVYSEKSFDFFA